MEVECQEARESAPDEQAWPGGQMARPGGSGAKSDGRHVKPDEQAGQEAKWLEKPKEPGDRRGQEAEETLSARRHGS